MLGADQPVAQHFEEASLRELRGGRRDIWRRTNGALVDFEEQSVLAAEVLEDGTLGDAERDGDVADAGGVITVLGEMLSGGFDDAAALCLGARASGGLALIERRSQRGCWRFLA